MSKHVSCIAILALAAGTALASSVIGLSVEDQARLSKLVVAGKVTAQQGVDHPENGLETAVSLTVTDVLKGDVRRGDVVLFHTRDGRVGDELSEAIGEAKLQTGQEVLVFVEEVDGRLYNLGLSMGVWSIRQDAAGRSAFVRALQDGLEVMGEVEIEHGPISRTDMAQRIERTKRDRGFENPLLRDMQLQGR